MDSRLCRGVRCRRPRHGGDDGAVAVEFALVVPLLVMLLLGTLTVGVAYSHSIGMTNAVREGARFAATAPYPATTGDWAEDVITRTRQVQFDDPGVVTRVCVDLFKQGSGSLVSECDGDSALGSPQSFAAPSGTAVGTCVVRVWAARTFTINAALFQTQDTMAQQAISMYERPTCSATS